MAGWNISPKAENSKRERWCCGNGVCCGFIMRNHHKKRFFRCLLVTVIVSVIVTWNFEALFYTHTVIEYAERCVVWYSMCFYVWPDSSTLLLFRIHSLCRCIVAASPHEITKSIKVYTITRKLKTPSSEANVQENVLRLLLRKKWLVNSI